MSDQTLVRPATPGTTTETIFLSVPVTVRVSLSWTTFSTEPAATSFRNWE